MLCYQSSREMAYIPADDPCNPGLVDDNYVNTDYLCGYELEPSKSGVYYHRSKLHRPSAGFDNVPLGCAHLHSSNGGYSSAIRNLDSPSPNRSWSLHPAIQSSTAFFTDSNTQSPYYQDGMNGISSWSPSGRADPFLFSGAIVTEPARHQWKSINAPPAEQCFDFRLGIEPQNEARLGFNGTTKDDEDSYTTPLFDLDKSSFTNDVCAVNRIGCCTSNNLANSFTEDRPTQHQSAINEEDHREVSVDDLSDMFPGCHRGHRASAHFKKSPVRPRSSSPKDPWLATSSTSSSTPGSTIGPVDEIWKCSACGRVLATKGTKNRNRNKRRHHCPGTGPKYPCHICPKVLKRDDTLLLHLRKQHPETNVEPPQPRKRKTL